jgi:hypothetical protein
VSEGSISPSLHHYTDYASLVGIIESSALWATHVSHLNDASEIPYSRKILADLSVQVRAEFPGDWAAKVVCDAASALASAPSAPDTFIASLCDDGDNLGQWRGYADQGKGFAIGFDRDGLRLLAQPQGFHLVRLMYNRDEQIGQLETALRDSIPIVAKWGADPPTAPPAIDQLLSLGIGFTVATWSIKNPAFRDEREWRLVRVAISGLWEPQARTRTIVGVEVPYEAMALTDGSTGLSPMTEVVLGPTQDRALEAAIRQLLDHNGFEAVPIRRSDIPLRG